MSKGYPNRSHCASSTHPEFHNGESILRSGALDPETLPHLPPFFNATVVLVYPLAFKKAGDGLGSYVLAKAVHMSTLTWVITRSSQSRNGDELCPSVPNIYESSPE